MEWIKSWRPYPMNWQNFHRKWWYSWNSPAEHSIGGPSPERTDYQPIRLVLQLISMLPIPTTGVTPNLIKMATMRTKTAFRQKLCAFSSDMDSYGAAVGITTIPCTLNTDRNYSITVAVKFKDHFWALRPKPLKSHIPYERWCLCSTIQLRYRASGLTELRRNHALTYLDLSRPAVIEWSH